MGTGKQLAGSKSRPEVSKSNHGRLGAVRLAPNPPHPLPSETDALPSDKVLLEAVHECVRVSMISLSPLRNSFECSDTATDSIQPRPSSDINPLALEALMLES